MTKIRKLLIGSVSGLTIFTIAVLVFIDVELSPTCVNSIIEISENSTHEYASVLFDRNCGATTNFTTQVSIIRAGHELPDEVGNVYIASGYPDHNGLTWVSEKTLHIGGAKYNAYKRLAIFKDLKIIYE